MRETPLEQALRTIPGIYSVDVSQGRGNGGTVAVKDAVGTVVLQFEVWPSNSGETCGLTCAGLTYVSEWDAIKVASKVVYGFYHRACSDPKRSWEGVILRELRRSEAARKLLPPAVADVVGRVRELYEAARGQDVPRAWDEMRKLMARMVRKGAMEEQLLKEWRETLVREVQES
jgi:hypothetical protein